MQIMQFVVVALILIGVVVGQPRPPPTPSNINAVTADGFDTVWIEDISYITELSVQTWDPNTHNVTFYAYGAGNMRTVVPGPTFYVGPTPNVYWTFPFIDFHTFQDIDSSVWGFGTVAPFRFSETHDPEVNNSYWSSFEYETVIFSTKSFPNTNPYSIFYVDMPIGVEGMFSSVMAQSYDPNNNVVYFAGFFSTNQSNPQFVSFGVYRVHLNMSVIRNGNVSTPWSWNPQSDVAVFYQYAQIVPFNSELKPILLHLSLVPGAATSLVFVVVIDPYWGSINVVTADQDSTVPLRVQHVYHRPQWNGRIVSATTYNNFILVGYAGSGNSTGWIQVYDVLNINLNTTSTRINFPTVGGYSNPISLLIDRMSTIPTLYVGFNGGSAILKIDISKIGVGNSTIIGYQALPFYLHRLWVGTEDQGHVYYATNEQHSKIFRVAKEDFCPSNCPFFGYCHKGKCVCSEGFEMKDHNKQCEWKELVRETERVKRNKGGEAALGVFFAISFVAAVAGWYMVYRNRRGAYQTV